MSWGDGGWGKEESGDDQGEEDYGKLVIQRLVPYVLKSSWETGDKTDLNPERPLPSVMIAQPAC